MISCNDLGQETEITNSSKGQLSHVKNKLNTEDQSNAQNAHNIGNIQMSEKTDKKEQEPPENEKEKIEYPPPFHCEVCNILIKDNDKIPHLKGKRHRHNVKTLEMKLSYNSRMPPRNSAIPPSRDRQPYRPGFDRHESDYPPNPDFRNRGRYYPYRQDDGPYRRDDERYDPSHRNDRGYGPYRRYDGANGPDYRQSYQSELRNGMREDRYHYRGDMDRLAWYERERRYEYEHSMRRFPRSSRRGYDRMGPRYKGMGPPCDGMGPKYNRMRPPRSPKTKPPGETWYCELCKSRMQMHDKGPHLAGKKHQAAKDHRDGKIAPVQNENDPCRYFLNGDCNRGTKCNYMHPKPEEAEKFKVQLAKQDEENKEKELGKREEEENHQTTTGNQEINEEAIGGSIDTSMFESQEIYNDSGLFEGNIEREQQEEVSEEVAANREEDELNNIMEGVEDDEDFR